MESAGIPLMGVTKKPLKYYTCTGSTTGGTTPQNAPPSSPTLRTSASHSSSQPLPSADGVFKEKTTTKSDASSRRKQQPANSLTQQQQQQQHRILEHVGARLALRKKLFVRRKCIADCCLAFALMGITLMVVNVELFLSHYRGPPNSSAEVVRQGSSLISQLLKSLISMSTCILLGFVLWYHMLDLEVFMIDNSMSGWRLALSGRKVAQVVLELLVCAVHPIPGLDVEFLWKTATDHGHGPGMQRLPMDVLLGLPMFLRLFLVGRTLLLHSRLFEDASSQSLGALNRIHFNFRFIFKAMMNLYPGYVLAVLSSFVVLASSWALRACETNHEEIRSNFFNSMWLVAITFLSVGYGDVVPTSYCGRGIAVITGMFGAGCTALMVAVLAHKLEFTRAEKYVHNFVMDVELDKRLKHAAANVLREGWLAYRARLLQQQPNSGPVLRHERRLLRSIRTVRELKNEQRRLADNAISLVELHRSQISNGSSLMALGMRMRSLDSRMTRLESKVDSVLALLRPEEAATRTFSDARASPGPSHGPPTGTPKKTH